MATSFTIALYNQLMLSRAFNSLCRSTHSFTIIFIKISYRVPALTYPPLDIVNIRRLMFKFNTFDLNYIPMKKVCLSILFCLSFNCNIYAQVPSYVPTSGLVGWWGFSGNANDASGNGNNFAVTGAALATDRNGTNNAAYQFNGTSQYLVNNNLSHLFSESGSFSVSVWVYKTGTGTGSAIMSGAPGGGPFIWIIQGNATDMMLGTNKQGLAWFWATTPFALNNWDHYVGVYTTNSMTFYKNGVLSASNTYTHTGATSTLQPLYVGRGASGTYLAGKADDIGIWDRALSSQEILDLYNASCGSLITVQPTSQNLTVGSSTSFVTQATGASYQWQRLVGASYQNIVNGGQYAGANTNALAVLNVTMANNNSQYRCRVAIGACFDTSSSATLTVCGLVSPQPVNQTVNISTTARMITRSNDPAATFQWQHDLGTGFINVANGGQYTGATNDTLTITNTNMSNDGEQFRCIVNSGSCIDTTSIGILTINNNVGIQENTIANLFSLYPNPTSEILNINTTAKLIGADYSIYDLIGEEVLKGTITGENTSFNISQLNAGRYLIAIGDAKVQGFEVVK
jgi:Concanavalin A-like lectin/glucanases superfamily/Secretion system C-terminal sorting domain